MSGATRSISHSGLLHTGQMHSGMPPLDLSERPLAYYEFWPPLLFYFPMFIYWAWLGLRHWGLGLPTVANPLFPVGGIIGESKLEVLNTVSGAARAMLADYTGIDRGAPENAEAACEEARAKMAENGLAFPVVAKPDIGSRSAGVRLIKSDADLRHYVETFPPGQTFILQAFVPYEAEAGVFYVRMPDEEKGRLLSLTLKYFPYVVGDGKSSLRELIENDPRAGRLSWLYMPRHSEHLDDVLPAGMPFRLAFAGSHARGAIFRDGENFITRDMTAVFDRIAQSIPEFHFGRFDVRFKNLESLQRGEDMAIIEINGAGSEATHIWDSRLSLWQAYRSLMRQYRVLWEIAARNRKRGYRPMTALQVWLKYWNELRLSASYPQPD